MECHDCGDEYNKVSAHWALGDCEYPSFTDKQIEILTGVLMGDGSIGEKFDNKRNPRFRIGNTNLEYLNYLYDKLQPLCTREPVKRRTPEQLAESLSGFSNTSDPADYKAQYSLQTFSHPKLSRFEDWYSTGEKVFPESIELTPTVLKHWFVCDGSYNNNGHRNYIAIHLSNERENKEKIERYFSDIGIPVSRWRDDKQGDGTYKTSIIFNVDETKQLFSYMGDCIPGFEYKWWCKP